jgi:hypothetical protein
MVVVGNGLELIIAGAGRRCLTPNIEVAVFELLVGYPGFLQAAGRNWPRNRATPHFVSGGWPCFHAPPIGRGQFAKVE